MILQLKRTPGIYLVGFMGCGKTTIGKLLAERIGWPFADLDEDIERAARMSISEIFDRYGEDDFRRRETEALRKRIRCVECGHPLVLALGGGAFLQPANFELIRTHGISIWLDCPLEIVKARLSGCANRPLARDPHRLEQLYLERQGGYARADYRVEVGWNSAETVPKILALPPFQP